VFETNVGRALGRTRGFNHYVRRFGSRPAPPGTAPRLDSLKAGAMELMIPARKGIKSVLPKTTGH